MSASASVANHFNTVVGRESRRVCRPSGRVCRHVRQGSVLASYRLWSRPSASVKAGRCELGGRPTARGRTAPGLTTWPGARRGMEAAIPVETDRIDRVAPTRRPSGNPVMFQSWRRLLFLHWEVPVEALRPLVPPQLAIDTYDGRAYVGLVPFTMMGVRPVWTPAFKPLSDFHEVNVRTYVHLDGADPGVWFLSLDAANALAVRIARSAWKLPYHFAEMDLSVSLNPEDVVAADGYAVGIGDWTETVDYRSS